MRVHDFHHSGRFDATPEQWAAAVEAACERGDMGAFTEARDRALPPRGWEAWSGGADGCLFWERSTFRGVGLPPITLTDKSWYLGEKKVTGHERHGVQMTSALLEHKISKRTLLRGVLHVPSGIQAGPGWSRKVADRDNVGAAKDVLGNLTVVVIKLQDLWRPDETTISADWNVHLGLAAWRDRVEDTLVGTGLALHPTTSATHGRDRTIDAHASTMDLATDSDGDPRPVRLLPKATGFDHRGVVAVLGK